MIGYTIAVNVAGTVLFFVLIGLPLLTILLIRAISRADHADERRVILKQGCSFGLLLGAVFMIASLFGNVIPLPSTLESLIDRVLVPAVLGGALFAFAASGYRTSRLTGQVRAASLAGLLTGVWVCFLFGLSFVIMDMVFFDIVRRQPEKISDFLHSGYRDMRTYLFDSTVRGATVMTVAGGILGAIFGSVGGVIGNRKGLQRRAV
jgi:hypothetical protein